MKTRVAIFGMAKRLVGILSEPVAKADKKLPAVIFINAGLQTRVGPYSRMYILMARRLAASGYTVLRFDPSGLGDTPARQDNTPFKKAIVLETQEAMDYLGSTCGAISFVLIGLCSGAYDALRILYTDNRVVGAVLIDVHLQSTSSWRIRAHAYMRLAMKQLRQNPLDILGCYKLLLRKNVSSQLMRILGSSLRVLRKDEQAASAAIDPALELRSIVEERARLFFVHAEQTATSDAFCLGLEHELSDLIANGRIRSIIVIDADHLFTLDCARKRLIDEVHQWLADGFGGCRI